MRVAPRRRDPTEGEKERKNFLSPSEVWNELTVDKLIKDTRSVLIFVGENYRVCLTTNP